MTVVQPERTEALEAIARAFKGAIAALRRMRGRETHHPGELSYAQYSLLFALRDQRAMSSSELAAAADLSPASVTEMLDGLAAGQLVERLRSPADRRVVLTSLTKRGADLVERRRAHFEPRWHAALERFSDEELGTAAAVLDAVRGVFDELAESGGPPPLNGS
jgi:DNA-binding MarR family transcriptional regulator